MEIQNLLPIGSIVIMKDGEKKLMIIGVMQQDASEIKLFRPHKRKTYDYLGVLYPEGHIGGELQYLFNHEDINEIVFRGFEDEERTEFLKKLTECCQEW